MLYANTNHPELRNEFPIWADRFKQILKKWRTLSNEQKAPYLAKARENRSAIRMKKAQQVRKFIFSINHNSLSSLLEVTLIELIDDFKNRKRHVNRIYTKFKCLLLSSFHSLINII